MVKSTAERGDPRVGMRGTIDAKMDDRGFPAVKIVLEIPEMNNRAGHQSVFELDYAGIDRLLASERNGAFEYSVSSPLDSGLEPRTTRTLS